MKTALSDRFLKSLKPAPAGKRITIWDSHLPSFGIRITDKARISFFVLRRPRGSRNPIRVVLGRYPLLSLATARERAREALRVLDTGSSPKDLTRRQQELTARTAANTFGHVAEDFIRRHASTKRTATAITQLIRNKLIARWSDRPICDVSRRDVIDLIEDIADSGKKSAAHQALIYTRRIFNWAIARDAYGLVHSPCDRVSARELAGPLQSRHRVLADWEIRAIWNAAESATKSPYPLAPFIKLLFLTGARRSEIAEATWSEIDFERKVWMFGAARMKNGLPHEIPMTAQMIEILTALPRFDGPFLFSTTFGQRPIAAFSKWKRWLDAEANRIAVSPLEKWRIHDIRRTVRTKLARLKVDAVVAELVIGHKQRGIVAVYDQHRYEDEKRQALETLARDVARVILPHSRAENVIQLMAS